MTISKRITRLDLNSAEANELSDALDLVINQPAGAARGNHANLILVMNRIFRVHLNKREALEGAIYALWREDEVDTIVSDDPYIWEIQQERARERRIRDEADTE